jgi:hypothetical protein
MERIRAIRSYRWQLLVTAVLREKRTMTTRRTLCVILFFGSFAISAIGQQLAAPALQSGIISGTVTDVNDGIIPGAHVVLQSIVTGESRTVISAEDGAYTFDDLRPGVTYVVTVRAAGFVPWTSPAITAGLGQPQLVPGTRLQFAGDAASVTVYAFSEQIAAEQVRIEERQRAFGVIPNFYVVYDHAATPLTANLKFKLALRASTDPVIFASVALIAGANQAAGHPDFGQGAKGYGQRMGALYANGVTDIMVGEAILPSLLHQDPRYFYQGTGTKKSRLFHALSSAFLCRGDNGRLEPNYSNIGGDLVSGAISNTYYPHSNRGVGLVFGNALVAAGGRMANGIMQEFILRRFTSSAPARTR